MESDLVQIERLLRDFRDLQNLILYRTKKLLQNFITVYRQHLDEKVHSSEKLLEIFKEKKLHHYDLFRIAGFTATENQLSDALASLLNPKAAHNLGIKPLKNVLLTIKNRNKKVSAILSVLDLAAEIQVIREYHLGNTIPDIAIISNKFIILIENKIRGRCETYTTDYQTKRQWKKVVEQSKILGIEEQFLLGIFLSPEGKYPYEKHFIPISVSEVVTSIKNAIIESGFKNYIEYFLNFYDWS